MFGGLLATVAPGDDAGRAFQAVPDFPLWRLFIGVQGVYFFVLFPLMIA